MVSDEAEPYNVFQFYFTEAMAALQTDSYLIKEDPSLKTFRNCMKGEDYLNSSWTDQLHQNQRLHIIYLAVDPSCLLYTSGFVNKKSFLLNVEEK